MPEIDLSKVCYIIVKAREFDAKEDVMTPDYGSNASDDRCAEVLEAYADDPTFDELKDAIDGLNWDEQCELVALAWVGRGDFEAEDWEEALGIARDEHTEATSIYLTGMPQLGDYLEDGLAAFELSCTELEASHL